MLAGAAAIGFAAYGPWATGWASIPGGAVLRRARGSLGFDLLLSTNGAPSDARPLLLGGAVFLGLAGLLLMVTHVPGVGVLWRIVGLASLTGTAAIAASAWTLVGAPPAVLAGDEAPAVRDLARVTQSGGVLELRPGWGLWLVTIGCGAAAFGALIPAARRSCGTPHPRLLTPNR
jgi:hypothetical protein